MEFFSIQHLKKIHPPTLILSLKYLLSESNTQQRPSCFTQKHLKLYSPEQPAKHWLSLFSVVVAKESFQQQSPFLWLSTALHSSAVAGNNSKSFPLSPRRVTELSVRSPCWCSKFRLSIRTMPWCWRKPSCSLLFPIGDNGCSVVETAKPRNNVRNSLTWRTRWTAGPFKWHFKL